MLLLFLYNQGQLTSHRVQLENAADATVYSQAKLAARNQNFVSYTNRAMVANEISIGQVNALMSWARRYANMGHFTSYPVYKTPVAPPSPVTFSDVLSVISLPYVIAGKGTLAVTSPIGLVWPQTISYFNMAVGVFQKLFALTTLVAQFEAHQDIVKGNQKYKDAEEIYPPFISFYFLVQNALMTYAGDNFDAAPFVDSLEENLQFVDTGDEDPGDLVKEYFPGETMISPNSPSATSDSMADATLSAYQYYSAIVNRNRDEFTKDRHWDFWEKTPDLIPKIVLNFGIIAMTIDLDLSFGTGVKADGGSSYVANGGLESANDIKKLGWAAIDTMSFGVQFDIGLFVKIRFCFFSCTTRTLLDLSFKIPIGFPLGGGSAQMVSKMSYAKRVLMDWDVIGTQNSAWGGEKGDGVNNGAFDGFHAQTLLWGQTLPPTGMFGGGASTVNKNYGGPPGFLSLGEGFREKRRGYEYTVALAIDLDDIETSDNAKGLNIGNANSTPADYWLDGNEAEMDDYTRFDLNTCARAEESSIEGLYQRGVWDSARPMTTISSAEVYFSNPMQQYSDGSSEPASLFSPFWDARLIEPSFVPLLIATGEIPFDELLGEDVPDDAIGVTKWLLKKMAAQLVEDTIKTVTDEVPEVGRSVVAGPLNQSGDAVLAANSKVVDSLADGLTDFVGSIGGTNCAG
jgi:hypothetical protein